MLHNGWGLNFLFYPVFPNRQAFHPQKHFFLMFKVASIFPKILFSPHVSYQYCPFHSSTSTEKLLDRVVCPHSPYFLTSPIHALGPIPGFYCIVPMNLLLESLIRLPCY